MLQAIPAQTVYYPESDGKPMGETDRHRNQMVRHIELLTNFFAGQLAYVSGDLLLYYEQGNSKKFIVPDAFVAKGIEPHERRVYKLWMEGKAPDFVLETTSRKTRRKDLVDKPRLYSSLGVKEYFMFDPDQEYLDPPLQGFRRVGDEFARLDPDATGSLESVELGLRLFVEKGMVQFERLDTGERLLTGDERALREMAARDQADAARREAEESQRREAAARREAEAEVARLRAELDRRSE